MLFFNRSKNKTDEIKIHLLTTVLEVLRVHPGHISDTQSNVLQLVGILTLVVMRAQFKDGYNQCRALYNIIIIILRIKASELSSSGTNMKKLNCFRWQNKHEPTWCRRQQNVYYIRKWMISCVKINIMRQLNYKQDIIGHGGAYTDINLEYFTAKTQ